MRLSGNAAALGPQVTLAGRSAKRPDSAPDRARRSWLLPTSVALKQTEVADRLSRPASQPSSQQNSKGKGLVAKAKAAASAAAQREAAARMSSGTQSQPHAWEEFLPAEASSAEAGGGGGGGSGGAVYSVATTKAHARGRPLTPGDRTATPTHTTPAQANLEQRRAAAKNAAFDKFLNAEVAPIPTVAEQRARMNTLCVPSRVPVPKVETDGISKGTVDWVQHYARQCPGPGAYEVQKAAELMFGPRGGRFSKAEPLSDVDRAVLDAASKPGPGEYRIKGGAELVPGGKFSGAKPKSETERQIEMKAKEPGPGEYGHINLDSRGHKLLGEGGGGFSKSSPPTNVDIIMKRAAMTPGPGAYRMKSAAELLPGGRFSKAEPLSDVDRAVLDAASKPGPGEYRIKGGAELVPGGKFSGAKPKSETERQIEMKAKEPGPGQYGAPKPLYFNKGGSGKFPFVFVPKDPKLKHLTKR